MGTWSCIAKIVVCGSWEVEGCKWVLGVVFSAKICYMNRLTEFNNQPFIRFLPIRSSYGSSYRF